MAAQPLAQTSELKQRVLRRLDAIKGLPTTVGVAVRLFGLPRGSDADPAEYARVISSDAGLTARILAIANSPWYGLSVRIVHPLVAVNMLGVAAVRTLAVNFCLSGLHHELRLSKEESHQFWQASLCKAVAARELASRLDEKVAEDAYIAALFQDVALPVMFAMAKEQMGPLLQSRLGISWYLAGERALFETDHAELGKLLAQKLGLPEEQTNLVGVHHSLADMEDGAKSKPLAWAAYAASLFPHWVDSWDAENVVELEKLLLAATGGKLEIGEFLDNVSNACRREFSYFDRSKVTEVRFLELMADATREAAEDAVRLMSAVREMEGYVASADQRVEKLAEEKSRLAEEAQRDPLTGAFNRLGFQNACQKTLTKAHRTQQPVALLYLDLDSFKDVNDSCGHAAGDEALRHLVAVVKDCTRGTDILGRLGGDEFAVLLPNCPAARATEIARRLQEMVTKRWVPTLANGRRHLSVSVGLTCDGEIGGALRLNLEKLLAAADHQMYAAKKTSAKPVIGAKGRGELRNSTTVH